MKRTYDKRKFVQVVFNQNNHKLAVDSTNGNLKTSPNSSKDSKFFFSIIIVRVLGGIKDADCLRVEFPINKSSFHHFEMFILCLQYYTFT